MSEALNNPVGRAMLESAHAMVDAMFEHQVAAATIISQAATDNDSVETQELAMICMAILIAIGQGKIPHVKWEPPKP